MHTQSQRAHLPEPSKQTLEQKSFRQHKTNAQSAVKWRQENGYTDRGGVVVLCQGKIQGWINELRDPQTWQPGCVAVDENGNEWIAVGGNDYDGSKNWKEVSRDPLNTPEKPLQVASVVGGNDLVIPFTDDELVQIYRQRALYEQRYQMKFFDLGAFVSHIVAQQLQAESVEVNHD